MTFGTRNITDLRPVEEFREHHNHNKNNNNNDTFSKPVMRMKMEPDSIISQKSSHSWTNKLNSSEKSDTFKAPFPIEDRHSSSKISQITPIEYLEKISQHSNGYDRGAGTPSSISMTLDLPGSRNSGSLTRFSGRGKKRMLSVSPISTSEILDLNEIIRTSPNSLVAFVNSNDFKGGFISRGSTGRNSSAASHGSHGSYGHLSPSAISTQICSRQRNHFAESPLSQQFKQHRTPLNMPRSIREQNLPPQLSQGSFNTKFSSNNHTTNASTNVNQKSNETHFKQGKSTNVSIQSSNRVPNPPSITNHDEQTSMKPSTNNDGESADEEDGEEDTEQRCLWKDCGQLFDSQSQLVIHVNSDHIQKNKKDCTCYWHDCSREEKPFKAMYMLVVHVRRHTGEKPHKCHYDGCNKAYSRLENLKTHLRSHTGERPYVCEVPGCEKAFSNASDRAKHQNRTHSTVKQYGCKVPGCPKRYTDPSSLRKHMKTVHGNFPQPNKKFKIDQPPKKDDQIPSGQTMKQEPIDNDSCSQSPNNKNDNYNGCNNNKQLSSHRMQFDNDGGGSSHSKISTTMSGGGSQHIYNGYIDDYTNKNSSTMVGSNNVDGSMQQRNWNQGQRQFVAPPNINDLRIDSVIHDFVEDVGPNLQVQVQSNNVPSLYKPIEQQPLLGDIWGRRLSNDSMKVSRRGSNASVGSTDSNYMSGNEASGSRRGSNNSIHSFSSASCSVPQPSPLPSRNLSPRRIAQTVIEGQVLDDYSQENMCKNGGTSCIDMKPVVENNEMQSRVSSGYGSQTTYFPVKSPNTCLSPTPKSSRELRRASEGTVRRVSDSGFAQTSDRLTVRRASEPIKVSSIIDDTPRRHSMSVYNVLPTPAAMQSINKDNNNTPKKLFQNNQLTHPQKFVNMSQMHPSPPKNASPYTTHPPHISQHQQHLQHHLPQLQRGEQYIMNERMEEDPLSMFLDNYNFTAPEGKENRRPSNQATIPSENIMNHQQQQPCFENFHDCMATQHQQHQIRNNAMHTQNMVSQHQTKIEQHENGDNGNFNFTLQWQANHFGPKVNTQQQQVMDTHAVEDKNIEELMISGLAALNTTQTPRPQTNMAINRMDTLLCSFTEENKYFENNQRYN